MADFISVQVDKRQLKQVDRLLKAYPRSAPTVLSRAVNKTTTNARTWLVKRTVKNTGLAQGVIFKKSAARRPIRQKDGNKNNNTAHILATGDRIPLSRFKAKHTKVGVTYTGRNSSRKTIPDAFIQTVFGRQPLFAKKDAGGHVAVLRRGGTGISRVTGRDGKTRMRRGGLIELFGPSIGFVVNKKLVRATTVRAERKLLKEVDVQLALELERIAKRK